MQRHSLLGSEIVGAAGLPEEARWVRHHHERIDGGGYPDGLCGEEIPLESRIILVADAFEAMTSDRPYRRAPGQEFAIAELRRGAGHAVRRRGGRRAVPRARQPPSPRSRRSRLRSMRGLEERLRLALEGTETGFWEWDDRVRRGRVVRERRPDVRAAPRHAAGRAATTTWRAASTRPTARSCAGSCGRAVEHGEGYEHDVRVELPDGGERWLHSRVRVLTRRRRPPERLDRPAHRRHRAPPARGRARVPGRGEPGARRLARPAWRRSTRWRGSPSRAWPTGAPSSSRRSSAAAYEQVAVAHVDPEKVRWARELQERYPPDPDAPTGAPEVIRSGRSELYPVIDAALLEAAALDDEQREIVRQLQMNSAMVVPMRGARPHARGDHVRLRGVRPPVLDARAGAGRGARPPRRAGARPRAAVRPRAPRGGDAAARAAARRAAGRARPRAGRPLHAARRARPRGRRLVRRVRAAPTGATGSWWATSAGAGCAAAATMGQIRNALRAYALKGARAGGRDGRPARARRRLGRDDRVRHGDLHRARPGDRRGRAGHGRAPAAAARARRRRRRVRGDRRSARRSGCSGAPPCRPRTSSWRPARRCGSTPTGSSSRASGRSTHGLADAGQGGRRRARRPRADRRRRCWPRCRARARTTWRCSGSGGVARDRSRLARWKVNSASAPPASPATGSSRNRSWSPASRRCQHAAGEPVRAAVEHGHALRPLVPRRAGELVHLVAGLAAEQLGQVGRVGGDAVHAEVARRRGRGGRCGSCATGRRRSAAGRCSPGWRSRSGSRAAPRRPGR